MNDHRIARLRTAFLEKDLRLTDCALRLMLRIYSDRVLDSKNPASEPFDLPWKQVAHWCGLSDKDVCYERAKELVRAGYLYDQGVHGCPPTNRYKLNLKLDLSKLVKSGLDGSFKDGVIPPAMRRQGNKDASIRKGMAALRDSAK